MANYVIPKVEKKDYPFSYRDLSSEKITSFSPGVLYPLKCWDVLPADKWNIRLRASIESFPMIAPAIGKWKASFDFYFEPWENLYGFMDGNMRMSARAYIQCPRWTLRVGMDADLPHQGGSYYINELVRRQHSVQTGSMFDFLGVPPGFLGKVERTGEDQEVVVSSVQIAAEDWLSYLDIFRNYYANPQEVKALYTSAYNSSNVNKYYFQSYSGIGIDNLDSFMMALRHDSSAGGTSIDPNGQYGRYGIYTLLSSSYYSSCGFFLRTYKMDLMRGIMSDEIDDYESTVEPNGDGSISITAFRTADKLQDLINEIAPTGGRFDRVQEMRWGKSPKKHLDRPIYLGSISQVIGQHDVIATASGVNQNEGNQVPGSVLGQQAGFTIGSFHPTKRSINLNAGGSYGTLVCIFSMVPYVFYSTGFELRTLKTTFADIFDPALARLGYQDVSQLEMKAVPTMKRIYVTDPDGQTPSDADNWIIKDDTTDKVVGKRVAWGEYMADLNRTHGRFAVAGDMNYWAFNRIYSVANAQFGSDIDNVDSQPELYGYFDATTYCKPTLWNHLFQDIRPMADNFRLHFGFDVDVIREIPKRVMPK